MIKKHPINGPAASALGMNGGTPTSSTLPCYYRQISERRFSATIENFLSEHPPITPEQVKAASPTPVPADPIEQATAFLGNNFSAEEFVALGRRRDRLDHDKPPFIFHTLPGSRLIAVLEQSGRIRQSQHGYLVRCNPVLEEASGKCGAHKDRDVTSYRNLLIENDQLPINVQLAIYASMSFLPIASLVLSGRRSVHCLLRVNARDEATYRRIGRGLMSALRPFRFDPCTINPSRLTRLPGATRGGLDDPQNIQLQELIYLNRIP